MRQLSRFTDVAYVLLRVVAGVLLACHGAQKLLGVLGGHEQAMWSQKWFGGVIELVGGALIALGLFTRPAAFLASGTMAVAYIQFHWKLDVGARFWPITNKGELAVVYCFLFLYVACAGGGRFSLDHARGRR